MQHVADLSWSRFGKAQTRLLKVSERGGRHELTDLNVTVDLEGDFKPAYRDGDNSALLPTDSQQNAVWAMANEGVGEIEDFARRLVRHFHDVHPTIDRARVRIEQYLWEPLEVDGQAHPHSFRRPGGEVRRADAVRDHEGEWILSGVSGLTVLKSADSEFRGFLKDRYTTLAETGDRILATEVEARWLHALTPDDWSACYALVRGALLESFAATYSHSLQQMLYKMGRAVLDREFGIAEIRLRMPDHQHSEIDLTSLGEQNQGLFFVSDRPYDLIEGAIARLGAPGGSPFWLWGP